MRIAYFDCFAGVSGDMTLGALVDAGVDRDLLCAELAKLPVRGYHLEVRVVRRGGLRGTKVDVVVDETGQPARQYTEIVAMLTESALAPAIRQGALEIFRRLGEVEAHLHNVPLESVHFHEVGAVDALVDVVGALIGLQALAVEAVMVSPVNVGSGTVCTAHGVLPVPAPATLELLKGFPSYASGTHFEMTTPTGAAIVTTLAQRWGPLPLMRVERVGYGAGTKDPPGFPNLLRLIVGDMAEKTETAPPAEAWHHPRPHGA